MPTVTSKDGTQIGYNTTGTGPAVILIDGAFCFRGFGPMPALAPLLAPHFTVYTYDRRGRGESGDTLPFALEREFEDIDALIQHAGGAASLYGISSGAGLALRAAASGLNVVKLALYEPPYDDNNLAGAATYTREITDALAAGSRGGAPV
jgi:pimeloyl-ACP methyl ester carboxylesterase